MDPAILLAVFLHRPPDLVRQVYAAGGIDAVAVVEMESNFRINAERREPRGSSWGLFQLYSRYWPQHRGDLGAHIRTGAAYLQECKRGHTLAGAVAHYNGGTHPGAFSRAWGVKVEKKRDELARWLRWRAIRAMETAR